MFGKRQYNLSLKPRAEKVGLKKGCRRGDGGGGGGGAGGGGYRRATSHLHEFLSFTYCFAFDYWQVEENKEKSPSNSLGCFNANACNICNIPAPETLSPQSKTNT